MTKRDAFQSRPVDQLFWLVVASPRLVRIVWYLRRSIAELQGLRFQNFGREAQPFVQAVRKPAHVQAPDVPQTHLRGEAKSGLVLRALGRCCGTYCKPNADDRRDGGNDRRDSGNPVGQIVGLHSVFPW